MYKRDKSSSESEPVDTIEDADVKKVADTIEDADVMKVADTIELKYQVSDETIQCNE